MKIKNQEKIMAAVKALLDAENILASVYAEPKRARETKKAATERSKRLAAAHNSIDAAREHLRKSHTEIIHEEYGP